jgi:hypothetical protein
MTQRIYIARAVDDREPNAIQTVVLRARRDFPSPRFEVIDPMVVGDIEHRQNNTYLAVLETQLDLLKSCDVILVDMSLPNHTYIGCVAELVYAHVWQLCTVVYVGSNRIIHRPWLRFHADHIDTSWEGAVRWIHARLQS